MQDKYHVAVMEIADCYPQKKSIMVDFGDISNIDLEFASYVLAEPDRCLGIARKCVQSAIMLDDPAAIVNIRIKSLPRDAKVEVRHLRADHLRRLVAVEGIARKVTTVKPRMTYALFRCARCGAEIGMPQPGMVLKEPLMCTNPDGGCNKQATRFILDDKASSYIDTQKIEIQESPEGLRGGAQPERLTGYVEDDISGLVNAGNRITMNGILRSVEKTERDKTTVFETFLDVISLEFEEHEYEELEITEEDEQRIQEMSKDPDLLDNIVKSISPSIFGHDEIKKALALQLFGGCHKEMDDGSTTRGDIHILLIGDPGVAKSQLLRYMEKLAPRAHYSSGKSASAAGLTAAAVRDDFGDGRWTLEAGALVLADKGLALIDELDKMTDQDRSSLHEAMESQRISIAKAGISATLQCRCSLLAAANPKYSRFREGDPIPEQINMPPSLLSRFDLIFVMLDVPEKANDLKLTTHILDSHLRGQVLSIPEGEVLPGIDVEKVLGRTITHKPVYDADILRKYVAYAKRFSPVMTDDAINVIRDSFLKIRNTSNSEKIAITMRQLEAYVRLSEAAAKVRLSRTVEVVDATVAADLIEFYIDKTMRNEDGTYDADKIGATISSKDRDSLSTLRQIMMEFGEDGLTVDELVQHGSNNGMSEADVVRTLKKMSDVGDVFKNPKGLYKLA